MSSNIIFSLDAEAVGAIAAVQGVADALQSLIGVAEGVVSSFARIADAGATMMSTWGSLMNNIGSMVDGFNGASGAMGGASKSANDLAYQLQRLGEESSKAAQRHNEAVQQIQQQEADLTAKTQEEISRRETSYNESLAKAVQSHQDALDQINEQQQTLAETYTDQMASTLLKLNDPTAIAHQQTLNALETQLAALLSSGQAGSAAVQQLQQEIDAENTKYQNFLNTTIAPYYKSLDKKNYDHHQTALEQLQDRLTKENRDYAQHTQDLKNQLDQQLADINTNYTIQERNLQEHLQRENESYAEQIQSIAEQRQHLLDNAALGGGGAAGGVGRLPGAVASLWLYDMLGIDPHADKVAAENALMRWVTGGSFSYKGKTTDFRMGMDTESQMTLPQIFTIVSQAIRYGQDPTRATHGNENYVNLYSDLLALSGTGRPDLSEEQRYNSLNAIMEKVMTGQTYGLRRQLSSIGIAPEYLEQFGVKFGGQSGETIENPGKLFQALMDYAYANGKGLGAYQAHNTPMGLVNLLKDWWSGVVFGVTGNINDPGSLIARFTAEFNKFVGIVYQYRPQVEAFGKSVGEFLLGKMTQFIDWLGSSDAKNKIKQIADALHDIGDALHWMSQHKDIILTIMGLLTAQVGSKLIGGLGGGLISGIMKGGLFGAAGQGAAGIAGLAGGPLINLLGGLLTGGNKPLGMLTKDDPSFLSALAREAMIHDALPLDTNKVGAGANDLKTFFLDLFKGRKSNDDIPLNGQGISGSSYFTKYVKPGALQGLDPFAAANVGGKDKLSDIEQMALLAPKGRANAGVMLENLLISDTPKATKVAQKPGLEDNLGGFLTNILPALPKLAPALAGIGPALGGIAAAAGPIALVVAAIAGLAFVIFQNRDKIMPVLKQLASFFQQQFSGVAKAVTGFTHEVGSRLHDTFGPGSLVYNILNKLGQFWSGAWGGIKLVFSGVWDVIVGVFKIAWSIISNLILLGMDVLSGKWGKVWQDIKNLVAGVFDGIGTIIHGALTGILGVLLGFFGGLWGMISGKALDFSKSITGWLSDIGTGMLNFFTKTIPQALGAAFSGMGDLLKKGVDFLIDHVLPGPLQGPVHSALGFEAGGQYPGNRVAKVGERGQELFFANYQGLFVSNAQIRTAMAETGGGGGGGRGIFIGTLVLPGVRDANGFYRELNAISGRYAEYGNRAGLS